MTVEESARPAAAGIKAVGQAIRPHCRSLALVLLTTCMAAAAHRLPAAARPEHPPADLGGGQAVLTAGMLSDTAAALNRQVQADPGLRGRIAVVDTSRGGLDAVRRDTLLLAYRTARRRQLPHARERDGRKPWFSAVWTALKGGMEARQ